MGMRNWMGDDGSGKKSGMTCKSGAGDIVFTVSLVSVIHLSSMGGS